MNGPSFLERIEDVIRTLVDDVERAL
jgi:hypothetical protein